MWDVCYNSVVLNKGMNKTYNISFIPRKLIHPCNFFYVLALLIILSNKLSPIPHRSLVGNAMSLYAFSSTEMANYPLHCGADSYYFSARGG